jgi:alpha-tubulin suppressor-like RCC1 family protein
MASVPMHTDLIGNKTTDRRHEEPNMKRAILALLAGGICGAAISLQAVTVWGAEPADNQVHLTKLRVSSRGASAMTANFSIAGGASFVPYDILTSTNPAMPVSSWNWLGIGYTSNDYTFSDQPRAQAFYTSARPQKTMVVGWGGDGTGQCDVPMGLTNAVMVAGGCGQSLALLADGTVTAWGYNCCGQGSVPANLSGVSMVACGWYHDVVLFDNGTVTAWGLNNSGVISGMTNVPAGLTDVTMISAQGLHSLALTGSGRVIAWGYGPCGEASVPAGLSSVASIAAGFQFNVVAMSDGSVTAWGNNAYGQANVPRGLRNVVKVAAGLYHGLALLRNGTVVAWGDDRDGETDVPAGLTNVVAIAAGGNIADRSAYSLALKSDGTVAAWGDSSALAPVGGLNNVIAIAAGANHALAIRTGPPTPVIGLEPGTLYQLAGGATSFTARGEATGAVQYQWQFDGQNISGATNATLSLNNAQCGQQGTYQVIVKSDYGSITSCVAAFGLVTPPVITSLTQPKNQAPLNQSSFTLAVSVAAPDQADFPLSYHWQFNGTNLNGATSSSYTFTASAATSGTYSVTVANAAGSTNLSWQVKALYPGSVVCWGSDIFGRSDAPVITNALGIAGGGSHSLAVKDDGTVVAWGFNGSGQASVPRGLNNVIAVAAGNVHSLALKSNGTVVGWGDNAYQQSTVPGTVTNAIAISAGGGRSLALLRDGTVVQWGLTNTAIPAGPSNVTAIASGTDFDLALLNNSTVVAWGANNQGQANVPAGLTDVVAIAAGGSHALALQRNGTVIAWGSMTDVPAGLSNVVAVAAGSMQSLALKNDGTLVSWGGNSRWQATMPGGMPNVKLIAAGSQHSLAVVFSPQVRYPVDVTKDLLLIYNTNSANSATVLNYYLQNRPLAGKAMVLGIGCPTDEVVGSATFSNEILAPYLSWLNHNPTRHPQYIVLFLDIPSRVEDPGAIYPSVQYLLSENTPGIEPFVTSINMNGTDDCIGYINKLAGFASNSPDKLFISATLGGYGNTNYIVDDVRRCYTAAAFGSMATNGVLAAGVSPSAVAYACGNETLPDGTPCTLPHLTKAANVAGYFCWGGHSSLGSSYATDGSIKWCGNSGWWIMETIESANGFRNTCGMSMGCFTQWFSAGAFGGSNYSNTPVGATSNVEEPGLDGNENSAVFFSLWSSGKDLAISAWNGRNTRFYQVIGDPFVTR